MVQRLLVDAEAQGRFGRDAAFLGKGEQALVHGAHALLAPRRDDRIDLVRFVLADEVADSRVAAHDLEHGNDRAVRRRHQLLAYDCLEHQRQLDANLELLDMNKARELFTDGWPFYTVTTDSCPVHYFEGASICNSMVANGCLIEGTVENSVIGRGVEIRKGAVVKNCVVLGHSIIDKDVHLECQVVDKWARITNVKELIATPENPGYVKRDDVL